MLTIQSLRQKLGNGEAIVDEFAKQANEAVIAAVLHDAALATLGCVTVTDPPAR